jgi:hypothetical protein
MANATNSINIQHGTTTLTRQAGGTPDRQVFAAFDVPNADLGQRPKLFYRVSPNNGTGQNVELQWTLNGVVVNSTNYTTNVGRSMHFIIDPATVLQSTGNVLEARAISGMGILSYSELVFLFGVNV